MNLFIGGFLAGIFTILIIKSDIFDLKNLRNMISFSTNGECGALTLLDINISEADDNMDKIVTDLNAALKSVGFLTVHGVKDFDPVELEKWTKWFFDISLQEKMKLAKKAFNIESHNVYRGYFPVVPGTHSFKEAFEIGVFNRNNIKRHVIADEELRNLTRNKDGQYYMRNILEEKNVFPVTKNETNNQIFMKVMNKYYRIYQRIGKIMMKLIAASLGFDKMEFDRLFGKKELSTFRLLHYPTRLHNPASIPPAAWDGYRAIVTGEHHDTGMLTIVTTFGYPGLQIKPPGCSTWLDIPSNKNKLVVNIGALLASMVENKYVATNHRVLDTGIDRYSLPFFYEPHYDADISKTIYGNVNHFVGECKKYGPWMTNRISMFYEYATTDFGFAD